MEKGQVILFDSVDKMIFRKTIKSNLSDWKNVISGHPVVILGNGPYLLENDLSLISGMFSIGTNRIFRIFSPTIVIWQDAGLYKTDLKPLLECPSIKACKKEIDKENKFNHFSIESGTFSFGNDPGKLSGYGCTGVLAIQMAVAMGASSLILLGTDCEYSQNGNTDFYGTNSDHKPHSISGFQKAMTWVLENCPIPVYNCSRAPYWPKRELNEIMEEISPERKSQMQWMADILDRG